MRLLRAGLALRPRPFLAPEPLTAVCLVMQGQSVLAEYHLSSCCKDSPDWGTNESEIDGKGLLKQLRTRSAGDGGLGLILGLVLDKSVSLQSRRGSGMLLAVNPTLAPSAYAKGQRIAEPTFGPAFSVPAAMLLLL